MQSRKFQKRFGLTEEPIYKVEWQISLKNLKYEGPCGIVLTITDTTPLKTKTLTVCRVLRPNERLQFSPKLQFFEKLCSHIFLLETFGSFGAPAMVRIPVLIENYDFACVHAIHLPSPDTDEWIDAKKVSNDAQSLTIEVNEPCGLYALIFRPIYQDIRITPIGGLFHFAKIPYAQLRVPKLSCKSEHNCRLTAIPIQPFQEAFCRQHFSAVRQIEFYSPFYYFHFPGTFTKENTVTLPLPDWATDENTNIKLESIVVVNKVAAKWEFVESALTTTKCSISFKLKNLGLICMFPRTHGVIREQLALEAIRRSFDMLIDDIQGYYRPHPTKKHIIELWMGYVPSYLEEEIHGRNLDAGYTALPRNPDEVGRKSLADVTAISSGPKLDSVTSKKVPKKTDTELIKYTFDRKLLNGSTLVVSLTGDFEFLTKEAKPLIPTGRQPAKRSVLKKKRVESDWPFDGIDKKGGNRLEADLGDTQREKMIPITEYMPDCYRVLEVILKHGAEKMVTAELSKILARYCLGAALENPLTGPVKSDANLKKLEDEKADCLNSQFDFQQTAGFEGVVICSFCTSIGEHVKFDYFRLSLSFIDALAYFNIDPQRELLKMQTGFEPSENVSKKEADNDDSDDDAAFCNPLIEGRALSLKSLQLLSEVLCHGLELGKDLNLKGPTLCSIAFWTLALPLRMEETNFRILKAWKNACLDSFKKRKIMESELLMSLEKNNFMEICRVLKRCMDLNHPLQRKQLKEFKRFGL